MEKVEVITIALLLIAIVLSASSVVMNTITLDRVEINEASPQPDSANLRFSIEQTKANSPEAANGIK